MENYDYIESGLILGLTEKKNFNKFKYTSQDFAQHGDAFKFVNKYLDSYGELPSTNTICENYPTLDDAAQNLTFEYALDTFKDQVLFRQVVGSFQKNKAMLLEKPKDAYAQIVSALQDIGLVYDEDVTNYDSGHLERYNEWKRKNDLRQEGMMGIPTSFESINKIGVGWMPGELVSLFARPAMGKTWLCVQAAAVAMMAGYKTLLISTEMPTNSISLRTDIVLAQMMGYNFSHKALRNGDDIDEEAYKDFLIKLNGRKMLICDHIEGQQGMTLDAISGLVRKHQPDFIVLDGVYLVTSGDSKKAMWEQSHSLFYGLKNLCMSHNIAMFVSTQANRDAADLYAPPRAEHVAFGDALLRASDVALSMCMVEDDDFMRVIQYQKYRDGELSIDNSTLAWDVDKGFIKENMSLAGEF